MLRSALNRIPGRLLFKSQSFFSKEGTTIDQELVYEQEAVGVVGMGQIDNRDREAYFRITMTPEGRVTTANAAVLWPYGNPTIGQGIFGATDYPAAIHGNDNSLDGFTAAAVETMPQMIFHPTKTLVGQFTLLCLRGDGKAWVDTNSLVSQADSGGTFVDATMTAASIVTQNYTLVWTGITGFSSATDFYDGLTFEPKVEFVDDNVAAHGLFNRRIKSVGGRLRGIPIGAARTAIMNALKVQYTGAVRGSGGAAKAAAVTVTGADAKVYLTMPLAQMVSGKFSHGVDNLREGEVAWDALPTISSGVRGAYFTTPIA